MVCLFKIKLLLPDDEEDDFRALEAVENLNCNLKIEFTRILSDQMLEKKDLVFIFLLEVKEELGQLIPSICCFTL